MTNDDLRAYVQGIIEENHTGNPKGIRMPYCSDCLRWEKATKRCEVFQQEIPKSIFWGEEKCEYMENTNHEKNFGMKKLLNMYDKLMAYESLMLVEKIVGECIRRLQKINQKSGMMQCFDDRLENLWEEICVQKQREETPFIELYNDYMYDMIGEIVDKESTYYERLKLWLRTEEGNDWLFDCEECENKKEGKRLFNEKGFPAELCNTEIYDNIFGELEFWAMHFSNPRIEKALEGEMD